MILNNQWGQELPQEQTEMQDPLSFLQNDCTEQSSMADMTPREIAEMWAEEMMQILRKQMGSTHPNSASAVMG